MFPSNVSTSILFVEVVQDEEITKYSTHSIWIVESFLIVTPSPIAPEVYEIPNIASSHTTDPGEYI